MRFAWLVFVIPVTSCFNPTYQGGAPCGPARECPMDFACAADDRCYPDRGCPAGTAFIGSGCTDLDECEAETDTCAADATCSNTSGSFDCACNAGFTGDGETCTDVDECANNLDDCGPDATCDNTVGSFTCTCNPGFGGDGRRCFHQFVELSTNAVVSCGVRSDGTLWCWGKSNSGALGQGAAVTRLFTPAQVGTDTDWTTVAVGGSSFGGTTDFTFVCGLRGTGRLFCWGNNRCNAVGNGLGNDCAGAADEPVFILFDTSFDTVAGTSRDYKFIAAGTTHICAIATDGSLWCWGTGTGLGAAITSAKKPTRVGPDDPAEKTWTQVGLGGQNLPAQGFTCGIRNGGELWCWGINDRGQVGKVGAGQWNTPQLIGTDADWTSTDGGLSQMCGTRGGNLMCWGRANIGEFGPDFPGPDVTTPAPMAGGNPPYVFVSVGEIHACARNPSDELWCLGNGLSSELANPEQGHTHALRQIPGGPWRGVRTGNEMTCARHPMGESFCWGNNRGEVVSPVDDDEVSPTAISTDPWLNASAGVGHTCAIKRGDQSLWCWGAMLSGKLGIPDPNPPTPVVVPQLDMLGMYGRDAPVPVLPGTAWKSVASGFDHTCGVQMDGSLWCWGNDTQGELGLGATDQSSFIPVRVSGPPTDTWEIVAAGTNFSCGTKNGGELWCWGQNASLQCGDAAAGLKESPSRVAASSGLQSGYVQIALGTSHGCAIRGSTMDCWGENGTSQLGNGLTVDLAPAFIHASTWRSVAAGDDYTCAVRSTGELYCWGLQTSGRLGNDVITATTVTTPVRTGTDVWALVSSSGGASCGIQQTGALACWGPRGDLVNNTTHPIQVGSSMAWTRLEQGGASGIAFQGDTLFSWGKGANGSNGLDRTFFAAPQPVPR